jgi:hypothetical protein|tara:strand:- start:320 stop:649 length:330 start_codon:yes stop_codon:yes gene_type:complete
MRELIKKALDENKEPDLIRREVIAECKKGFDGVDNDTFYRWYKTVIKEDDIKNWEKDCKIELDDKLNDRRDLKELIYQRNKKIYTENKDPDEVKNAERTLLTHFLNKIQ